jgi:hypothetical protein
MHMATLPQKLPGQSRLEQQTCTKVAEERRKLDKHLPQHAGFDGEQQARSDLFNGCPRQRGVPFQNLGVKDMGRRFDCLREARIMRIAAASLIPA